MICWTSLLPPPPPPPPPSPFNSIEECLLPREDLKSIETKCVADVKPKSINDDNKYNAATYKLIPRSNTRHTGMGPCRSSLRVPLINNNMNNCCGNFFRDDKCDTRPNDFGEFYDFFILQIKLIELCAKNVFSPLQVKLDQVGLRLTAYKSSGSPVPMMVLDKRGPAQAGPYGACAERHNAQTEPGNQDNSRGQTRFSSRVEVTTTLVDHGAGTGSGFGNKAGDTKRRGSLHWDSKDKMINDRKLPPDTWLCLSCKKPVGSAFGVQRAQTASDAVLQPDQPP